jgi:hypothetical protein
MSTRYTVPLMSNERVIGAGPGLLASILGIACATTGKPEIPTTVEHAVSPPPTQDGAAHAGADTNQVRTSATAQPPVSTSATSPSTMTPRMLTEKMPVDGFQEGDDAAAIVDVLHRYASHPARVAGISFREDGRVAHAGIEWVEEDAGGFQGQFIVQGLLLKRGAQGWTVAAPGEEMEGER